MTRWVALSHSCDNTFKLAFFGGGIIWDVREVGGEPKMTSVIG